MEFSGRAYADVIELVTSMDYPPFVSNEVPDDGLVTALVRESYAVSGHTIKLRLMPWKRAYRAVEQGQYHGTFVWSHSREREQDFLLSVPVFANVNVIFTTLKNLTSWREIEKRADAGRQSILCTPLGWKVSDALVALRSVDALKFVEPEKLQSCLNLMLVGRAHMVTVPRMNFLFAMGKMSKLAGIEARAWPKIYEIDGPPSEKSSEHLMFTRNTEGLRLKTIFDHGFRTIVANGKFGEILQQHLASFTEAQQVAVIAELHRAGVLPE